MGTSWELMQHSGRDGQRSVISGVHFGVDRTSPWIETGEEVCKERKDDS